MIKPRPYQPLKDRPRWYVPAFPERVAVLTGLLRVAKDPGAPFSAVWTSRGGQVISVRKWAHEDPWRLPWPEAAAIVEKFEARKKPHVIEAIKKSGTR